jgi:MoxR-like ATPase
MTNPAQGLDQHLQAELGRVVLGLSAAIRMLTTALLARGHVLIEGPPGLGKTLLSKSLARALGGEFKRIQGTADLMPSDITGVHVFESARQGFVFRPGPIFADVVLADEINRATEDAIGALEAMEERQVTVERDRFQLPADFLVIATQNRTNSRAHSRLPESQLDRFMLRIELGYPERDAETAILSAMAVRHRRGSAAAIHAIERSQIEQARIAAASVARFGQRWSLRARHRARLARARQISLGVSTRGRSRSCRCAHIAAALRGRVRHSRRRQGAARRARCIACCSRRRRRSRTSRPRARRRFSIELRFPK